MNFQPYSWWEFTMLCKERLLRVQHEKSILFLESKVLNVHGGTRGT